MPKHWLPPSLMPLLEVLIFERKNWAEEQQRKHQELAQLLAKAELQIGQLEAQLAAKIPLLPKAAGGRQKIMLLNL
jgi:arginine deiminase